MEFRRSARGRAAAFEPRLAAVVADPGIEDPFLEFPPIVQDSAKGDEQTVNTTWNDVIVKGSTPEQTFELKKRLEIWTREALQQVRAGQVPSDWYAISRRMQEFAVTDLLGRITVPFLVTRHDGDALNPQAQQVLDGLGSTEKQLRTFTYGQGAQLHDAPMAPQNRNEVIFDWLGTHRAPEPGRRHPTGRAASQRYSREVPRSPRRTTRGFLRRWHARAAVVIPALVVALAVAACTQRPPAPPSDAEPEVHITYYPWFGTPETDGEYHHWTHPVLDGTNRPTGAMAVAPDDIGAGFWPEGGLYSSNDPATVDRQMEQIAGAGIDVVV
ncbi:MAG: hypothetical protein ACKO5A_10235, partial [Actinomycetota bacterium]